MERGIKAAVAVEPGHEEVAPPSSCARGIPGEDEFAVPTMPTFKYTLAEEEIWDIVAYVRKLHGVKLTYDVDGRKRELDEAERALAAARLVTLTGSGGCGKTRLALALARRLVPRFKDGCFIVDLASLGFDSRRVYPLRV